MKQICILLISIFSITQIQAQYTESFSIPNQGIIAGPCTSNDPNSCVSSDFSGVDWTITGDLSGLDADNGGETFQSMGGVLTTIGDIDEEICWVSPMLDIGGSTQSFSVDVTYTGFDDSDYLDVEYSVDGGGWTVAAPNTEGALGHTISGMSGGGLTGSTTISQGGINGATLQIRVCADFNTTSENFSADNISAPQANVLILPVKLINFQAEKKIEDIIVSWSTLSEINNAYFSIERSYDGRNFEEIGSLSGANNTNDKVDYSFTDKAAETGKIYYRLKQVDYDGRFEYSKVIHVESKEIKLDAFTWNIYPNPSVQNQSVDLRLNTAGQTNIILNLLDINSKLIYTTSIASNQQSSPFQLETSQLNKGIYILQLKTDNKQYTKRLIIN